MMQKKTFIKNYCFTAKRTAGYLFGFALLYAPFELYRSFMENVLEVQPAFLPHAFCPRIPTSEILTGGFFSLNSVMIWSTLAFWLLCLFIGPFFCGRLCAAGYFTEALSGLLPDKYKIEWEKYLPAAPIRYGMLFAYMALPLWYSFYPCAYCNFYLFDTLIWAILGAGLSLTMPLMLSAGLYFILFGLFTKGGRGYCRFLCPQGAMQSLFFVIGSRLGLARKININREACVKCGLCIKNCPMRAMSMEGGTVKNSTALCIKCDVCKSSCPRKAIFTGR